MTFKKVNAKSVVQQVLDSLTEAMVNKELRPGDKIPTEIELAEQLGVGRNSVREAIKILVYLGVLEIRRAEGTFVCEGVSQQMIDPMVYGIVLDSSDSYDNLMELRELLEVGVLNLAMRKADQEDILLLKSKLDALNGEISKGEENVENVFQADNEFHQTISQMGKNPLVTKVEDVVRMLTHAMRYDSVKGMLASGRSNELYEAHERLYHMVEEHSAEDVNTAVRNTYFVDAALKK